MAESKSHRSAKNKAAGKQGSTEVPLPGGKRLDALTASGKRATEVERSGDPNKLNHAARRLKLSGAQQRVLQVPQHDMSKAVKAMRNVGVSGTVKNITGSKKRSVKK